MRKKKVLGGNLRTGWNSTSRAKDSSHNWGAYRENSKQRHSEKGFQNRLLIQASTQASRKIFSSFSEQQLWELNWKEANQEISWNIFCGSFKSLLSFEIWRFAFNWVLERTSPVLSKAFGGRKFLNRVPILKLLKELDTGLPEVLLFAAVLWGLWVKLWHRSNSLLAALNLGFFCSSLDLKPLFWLL